MFDQGIQHVQLHATEGSEQLMVVCAAEVQSPLATPNLQHHE